MTNDAGQVAAPATSGWVWAGIAAGYVQASALLLTGLAADVLPGARGAVGLDVVTADGFRPWGIALVALALLSFLGCAFLWLGHLYGALSLLVAGALGTLVLVAVGSWVALVVPGAMTALALLVVGTPAIDHLHPAATEAK